jgi:hypothetical protein
LQIEEPVKPEAKLKKYRWYLGLLFAFPMEGLSSLSLSVPTVSNKVCPLMQSMPLLTGDSLSPINFNVEPERLILNFFFSENG